MLNLLETRGLVCDTDHQLSLHFIIQPENLSHITVLLLILTLDY